MAVNPCGLQAEKPDFHVSTVKSRNNQIWIFLFEDFNLAHSSSPSTFEVFGTRILAAKCSQSFDFGQDLHFEISSREMFSYGFKKDIGCPKKKQQKA
jgi:hypothetical protein